MAGLDPSQKSLRSFFLPFVVVDAADKDPINVLSHAATARHASDKVINRASPEFIRRPASHNQDRKSISSGDRNGHATTVLGSPNARPRNDRPVATFGDAHDDRRAKDKAPNASNPSPSPASSASALRERGTTSSSTVGRMRPEAHPQSSQSNVGGADPESDIRPQNTHLNLLGGHPSVKESTDPEQGVKQAKMGSSSSKMQETGSDKAPDGDNVDRDRTLISTGGKTQRDSAKEHSPTEAQPMISNASTTISQSTSPLARLSNSRQGQFSENVDETLEVPPSKRRRVSRSPGADSRRASPGADVRQYEVVEMTKLDSPDQRLDQPDHILSSSSSVSLASHTPSLGRTPTIYPSTHASGTQLSGTQSQQIVVRSSQDSENADDEYDGHAACLDDHVSELGYDINNHTTNVEEHTTSAAIDAIEDLASESDSDSSIDLERWIKKASRNNEQLQTGVETGRADRSTQLAARSVVERRINLAKQTPKAIPTPKREYRYNLSKLVKDAQAAAETEAAIKRATALFERSEPASKDDLSSKEAATFDKDLLASVVVTEDGEDNMDKILLAIDRTEALRADIQWHFFRGSEQRDDLCPPGFPSSETSLSCLEDPEERDHAFLTGFAQEMAYEALSHSNKLIQWLFESALFEPREDLARSHLMTLQACRRSLTTVIEPDFVFGTFEKLMVHESVLVSGLPVDARQQEHVRESISPWRPTNARIIRLLDIFAAIAEHLSVSCIGYLTGILLCLGSDTVIAKDSCVYASYERAIVALVGSLPGEDVCDTLNMVAVQLTNVTHPLLQLRLINAMPGYSPPLHLLRRRLSLAYFLHDYSMIEKSFANPLQATHEKPATPKHLVHRITDHLSTSPAFKTTDPSLDYINLAALIDLLDIGIDNGFSPSVHNYPASKSSSKTDPNKSVRTPSHEPIPAFNADVDRLADMISALSARIHDAGAAHMARSDAKAVLDRVDKRLRFSVRTVRRMKESLFDSNVQPERDLMALFLAKSKAKSNMPEASGGANVGDVEVGDVDVDDADVGDADAAGSAVDQESTKAQAEEGSDNERAEVDADEDEDEA